MVGVSGAGVRGTPSSSMAQRLARCPARLRRPCRPPHPRMTAMASARSWDAGVEPNDLSLQIRLKAPVLVGLSLLVAFPSPARTCLSASQFLLGLLRRRLFDKDASALVALPRRLETATTADRPLAFVARRSTPRFPTRRKTRCPSRRRSRHNDPDPP